MPGRDGPAGTRRSPRLTGPMVRTLAVCAAAVGLSACAARFQPMGVALAEPALTQDAVLAGDGYHLPIRTWLPARRQPRAVLLALHGFTDYSNSFAGVGPYLSERGIAVYAFDQRGFGATRDPGIWPGTETLVADLEAVARTVRRLHPDVPLILLGESMGGAVVLNALAGERASDWLRRSVARVVLVAPAVWGWSTMNALHKLALVVAYNAVPGLTLTAPRELGIRPSDNIDMLRALARDPLVLKGARVDAMYGLVNLMDGAMAAAGRLDRPHLVLLGAREQVIPPQAVDRLLTILPPAQTTVVVYPEGYHMLLRDHQAERVLADLASWLSDPAAPLPSGLGRHPSAGLASTGDRPGP